MYVADDQLYRKLREAAVTEDSALQPALAALRAEVAALANQPAPAVTDKGLVPHCPEVGRHDYVSLGSYWWPDPDQPNGLPYIRRDGRVNPEGSQYDITRWNRCFREIMVGRELGVELWDWQTEDGRGLRQAVDHLYYFACSKRDWAWEQIGEVDWGKVALTLTRANRLQPGRYPIQGLTHRLPEGFHLEDYLLRQAAF